MANDKRLIDANAVVEELEYEIETQCEPVADSDSEFEAFIKRVLPKLLRDVIKYIKEQPTVDAVEVVHGRWEPDLHHLDGQPYKDEWYGYILKCSACGGTMMGDGDLVCRDNYCPNCGAKMDGDGNG